MLTTLKHIVVRLVFIGCTFYAFYFLFGVFFFESIVLMCVWFVLEEILYHGFLKPRINHVDSVGIC